MPSASLADLYAGASIKPKTAKSLGSVSGSVSSGRYFAARRKKVQDKLASGHASISSLGASDLAVLSISKKPNMDGGGGGGLFHKLTGFVGNLGKDISNLPLGLAQGAYQLGKNAATDIGRLATGSTKGSALWSNVVSPMAEHYKETYSGDVGSHIYDHPLGPILDLATVASLGAGGLSKVGQAAARSGDTSGLANLAKITSREGRAPIALPRGESIAREYTPRPLAKAGQIGLDKLGERVPSIGGFQARKASNREDRLNEQEFKGQTARDTAEVARPIAESMRGIDDPDIALAFSLAIRGVNTPERLAAYQSSVREAMADPEKVAKREALGIPVQVQARRANIPERVQRLILDPTFEPDSQAAMQKARKTWESDVQLGLSKLPVEPEVHQAKIGMYQRLLDKTDEVVDADFKPGQIEPGYAPDVAATNLETYTPNGKFAQLVPGMKTHEEQVRVRGYTNRRNELDPGAVTNQNVFVASPQRYLANTTGETFMEGLFRADPGVWVEHAVRRERDLAEKAYKRDLVERAAAKDEEGNLREFKTANELRQSDLGETHVLVNAEFPLAWFRAETNFSKQAAAVVKRLREAGDEANETVVQSMIDQLTDADAKAFLSSHWGAMRKPGVAVPTPFFEHQRQLAQVSDPFQNAGMRVYALLMHKWRNTVLAYMPRWGLNTAIGSFITNVVKGVVNPMDYVRGNRLGRTYADEAGNIVERPSALAQKTGAQDLDFSTQRFQKMEPAGVSLQGEAKQEMLDESQGRALNFPTQKLVAGVQHIEDFFRRASFQQSLRKMDKEYHPSQGADLDIEMPKGLPTTGEAKADGTVDEGNLENLGDVVADTYKTTNGFQAKQVDLLQDPRLVQRAIRDTNKFGYNYGALGPFERRYVRSFMPFYGWYKFISVLAAKLPVEYPGRTAMINNLATVGNDMYGDMGAMPEWIKGSIIIGLNPDGTIKYLPARGMNPFSSFFNPLDPGQDLTQISGMLNPAIQGGLQAIGYDTLTGDSVRVSPQSGVERDFFGNLARPTGEQVAPRQVQALPRGLMGILRSVPAYRLGEKYFLEHGASVYPEHVPFGIQTRLMAPESENDPTPGAEGFALSVLGVNPKGYDLKNFQNLSKKRAKYIKTKIRHSVQGTERKFSQP